MAGGVGAGLKNGGATVVSNSLGRRGRGFPANSLYYIVIRSS
jgi:hypothetical protein